MRDKNNIVEPDLCTKFCLGYKSSKHAHTPISEYRGSDIVVLLGHLFRIHGINPPKSIHINHHNFKRFLSNDNIIYSFSMTANGIIMIAQDGPNKGELIQLNRLDPDNDMLNTIFSEIIPTPEGLSDLMRGFAQ